MTTAMPARSALQSRTALLGAAAGLLILAVMLVPFPLASALPGGGYPDVSALGDAMDSGFVAYWRAGTGSLGSGLQTAVDFWARFHIIKAVLAAVLLAVLVPLGSRIWGAYATAPRRGRRLLLAVTGVFHAGIALLALLVLVANIQGAIAPLSSALGLMSVGDPGPALADVTGQVRDGLDAGQQSAALDLLVRDFTVYHAAMAGVGTMVTVGLLVAAVILVRRRARMPRTERRLRRVHLLGVVSLICLAALFGLVTVANVSTVAHPAAALLGFFDGGL